MYTTLVLFIWLLLIYYEIKRVASRITPIRYPIERMLHRPHEVTWKFHLASRKDESMKKIALVDDHADIRRLIRITLGKNYEVFEAEDGASGLALIRQQRPDLAVLDVMMPGTLDGLQLLDAIKADPQLAHTRVIMVTARGQASDREAGMQRGADAYYIKPFSPLQLAAAIRELLGA